MNWKISFILIIVSISACKQNQNIKTDSIEVSYLIEADELKAKAKQTNIKIIDFRKKEIYEKEHIAGALNIWRTDIEDSTQDHKGIMASKTQIETLFGKLGIKTEDTIIVYDDIGLCNAARFWWLLQNYDFKNVRLLHGGLEAWKSKNGKTSNLSPNVKETVFTLNENPKMTYYVSKEEVQDALINNTLILDTRTTNEFLGKTKKNGATKGGRIPKSINIDWGEAINYGGDKHLKPIKELEIIYSKLKIKKTDPIIVYCHSGVRSAHTTFVLTQLLGYTNVKNYDGSWIEWSYYKDLPFEKDSITLIKN